MDVAMIYRGDAPHPAHRGFAEAVNADLLALDRISLQSKRLEHSIPEEIINGTILPSYDVYIAEGTRSLYGAITNQMISESKLIYLAADQVLYTLTSDSYDLEVPINRIISNYGMWLLRRLFNRHIDGVIAVSDFAAEYTGQILTKKPIRVAHPYIQPDTYSQLSTISPQLDQNIAVTVGSFDKYKGKDILVDAWQEVTEQHSNAELLLVGSGYPKNFDDVPGIQRLGFVDDLPSVLSRASLYVQPSRADSFPVSVLEALRAGLPAVVTTTTGTKSEISKLDERLITETTAESLAAGICTYFSFGYDERHSLSQVAASVGSRFDSESRRKQFKSQFESLLREI